MLDSADLHLVMVQMPALKTPQFDWARNKTSRRPQPAPPIFQPEVAVEAIVYAAHSRRREVWVGDSTVLAILANKFLPGPLDRYLVEKGYTDQLTGEPADQNQLDNLFAPVPDNPDRHGRFESRAIAASPQLWVTRHRSVLIRSGLAVAGFLAAIFLRSRAAARNAQVQAGN